MLILLKFLIGGIIAISIDLISRTKYYFISGLIPLFPAFGLLAHIIVFNNKGTFELKQTIIIGLLSLLPYAIYLISLFFLINKTNLINSLIMSIILWFLFAFIIIYYYQK